MNEQVKHAIGAAVFIAVLLLPATPVAATDRTETNAVPDGDGHPYVACVVADPPPFPSWCGNVTLIAPNVVLSAAHVALFPALDPGMQEAELWVSFVPDGQFNRDDPFFMESNKYLYPVVGMYAHPAFDWETGRNDIGVFVLGKNVKGIQPAALPTEGLLDELGGNAGLQGVDFRTVDFGGLYVCCQDYLVTPPDGIRRTATAPLLSLDQDRLRLLTNITATQQGAPGMFNSGAPVLLEVDGREIVLGTGSWGGGQVADARFSRLDTPSARAFLDDFGVTLP